MNNKSHKKTLATSVLSDERWIKILTKDTSADGQFYYSVKTTGIYCRPSCGSRTPLPENIQFHLTTQDAELSGFRPCKRCQPNRPPLKELLAIKVTQACKLIEASDEMPSLAALAEKSGLSRYHFHRTFKALTGLTPKAYSKAHLENKIRNKLQTSGTITDAIVDAGYNANSRFYEQSNQILGMKPSVYRFGGNNTKIRFAVGECTLGSILVASSSIGVCAILIGDSPESLVEDLQNRFPNAELIGGDTSYETTISKVVGFVEAPQFGLDLPLDIRGTAFQKRVWQALRNIPAGETLSYSEVADKIGSPKAVRAVAGACAANVIAVAIPCHRVVRSDGDISGYRWGVERKKALLTRESSEI